MSLRFVDKRLPYNILPEHPGHFIGSKFCASGAADHFSTIAPANDDILALIPHGNANDIDAAVSSAKKALLGPWGKSTVAERAAVLKRLAMALRDHLSDFARLESLDTGKPLQETQSGDIPRACTNLEFFAELSRHTPGMIFEGADGSKHTIIREPMGIVGLITPWNLPLYLATWKIAPALICGNSIILKPAELTPLTAIAFAQLCQRVGLPEGVLNIVHGYGENSAGQALVQHPEVKAISFTGETLTGSAIMKDAATNLKKLSFELGGKGASIVFADADLDLAAETVVKAAYRNQGQICLAGSRLLVEAKIAPQFIDRLLALIQKIRLGDPLDPTTTMGSLIARSHRDRVEQFVAYTKRSEKGCGEILIGGKIPAEFSKGAYYEPTIIAGVSQESVLIQDEIFGPVLTIQTFQEKEEAIDLANGTKYGLSCSIWTRDLEKANHLAAKIRCGLVWINSWFLRDLHTAFGGMKRSGIGREGGIWSLDFFSELKTISSY